MSRKSSETIDKVFALFDKYGHRDYIGENVTQLEHAVQCAMMAEKEDGSVEVRSLVFGLDECVILLREFRLKVCDGDVSVQRCVPFINTNKHLARDT